MTFVLQNENLKVDDQLVLIQENDMRITMKIFIIV
ncbi:hypothetical protein OROMI_013917 [Orobanche minor]